MKYEKLSDEIKEKIVEDQKSCLSAFAFDDANAFRRNPDYDKATILRPPFVRDTDKIMHCPYFNRYSDKTQVFSLYKNDDLSRRALHVQLVSRIARTIGRALQLNQELIEAIALGHDIGHTPFAHTGERFLDELYSQRTGLHFNHNIQSVRVLDKIFPYNVTFQTLDGIACHNGELELSEYFPSKGKTFEDLDREIEHCCLDSANIKNLVPSTLEGCVVRISDIIAYLGKDRQDAERAKNISNASFDDGVIGTINAEIINNLITNIVENSYGKPYIKMDKSHFEALKKAKADNYDYIYMDPESTATMNDSVKPMMAEIYDAIIDDLKVGRKSSPVYTHHIDLLNSVHYTRETPYEMTDPDQIAVDFIASMTDDYFIELYQYMYPDSNYHVTYKGYFD